MGCMLKIQEDVGFATTESTEAGPSAQQGAIDVWSPYVFLARARELSHIPGARCPVSSCRRGLSTAHRRLRDVVCTAVLLS